MNSDPTDSPLPRLELESPVQPATYLEEKFEVLNTAPESTPEQVDAPVPVPCLVPIEEPSHPVEPIMPAAAGGQLAAPDI